MRRNCLPIPLLAALLCLFGLPPAPSAQNQLLPDVFFDDTAHLDNSYDTLTLPGRLLFRFRTSIPNIGLGELRLRSTGQPAPGGYEAVEQVIQLEGGGSLTRPVGGYVYDPEINRLRTLGWVDYYIREVAPGDGLGPFRRHDEKEVVNITSSLLYDDSLPNVPPPGNRLTAANGNFGISVGYTDIYTRNFPNQWIDITGLVQGEYWLELQLDNWDYLLESNENNNITRVKITLNHPLLPTQPRFTPDQNQDASVSLTELLRVIQFFNSAGFHCDKTTEDGYAPGVGEDIICDRHASDYAPEDWTISLSEILRLIQFYNIGGYDYCPDADPPAEDGFCPKPA